MDFFFVSKRAQENGDHEVHTVSCDFLPEEENRIFWGFLTIVMMRFKKQRDTIQNQMDADPAHRNVIHQIKVFYE